MSPGKKILIISHIFPPTAGIGGRRWAKFAKYLSRNGNEVFVICAENATEEKSLWLNDISDINIKVFPLPMLYPRVLGIAPKNIYGKFQYKIALTHLKLRTVGNYYDRGQFWKKQLQDKALDLIKKNGIQNVIVSGAPFHLLPAVVSLKEKIKHLNVICDLRDPWVNNPEFFGIASLSDERKKHEAELEKYVATQSDTVITVAERMTAYYIETFPLSRTKFITLHNGYDPDEFPKPEIKNNSSVLKLIFAGTLYPGTEYLFQSFFEALVFIRNTHPEIYNRIEFNFYGKISAEFYGKAQELGLEIVHCFGSISLKEVQQKISGSDLGMLFLNRSLGFSLSTKYFEYLAQNKKIAVFSDSGETQDFVIEKKIGYALRPETMKNELLKMFSDFESGKLFEKSDFDTSQYSLPSLTASLEKLFI